MKYRLIIEQDEDGMFIADHIIAAMFLEKE